MDSGHGSGSSKSPRTDAGAINKTGDSLAPLDCLVDSEHENASRTDSKRKPNRKESISRRTKSSRSVSSDSSSDDVLQVEPKVLPGTSASRVYSPETDDIIEDPLFTLEELFSESAGSFSRVSDVTHKSLLPIMSQMQSPPSQVMDRNGGYDPDRNSASIFSSKPPTPMDWSIASTGSLFSIHIGNISFARDHVSMTSGDMFKSGELYRSGELHKTDEFYVSRELQILGDLNVEDPRNSSTKAQSDGSGTSDQSFTFPILMNGGINISGKEQHIQPQSSTKVSKAASKSWCSCFSRCPC